LMNERCAGELISKELPCVFKVIFSRCR